jgi:hypothetical protein
MSFLDLLPVIVVAVSATLTWAMVRHVGLSHDQRVQAASRPRSRPYATTLPDSLLHH